MSKIADGNPYYISFCMPDNVCIKCGAFMWFEERVQKDYNPSEPLFSLCCKQGRVKIAYLDFPEELNELYYSND